MPATRIAFVADIHHGQNSFTKQGVSAERLMAEFRRFVAEAAPDCVVDLGDRISDVDRDTDLRLEREAAAMFAPIGPRRIHLNGNHDRDHLDVADNEAVLGQGMASEVIDLGAWDLVVWRADTRLDRSGGGLRFVLPEADLLWLARTLRAARKPLAIVTHVPVSGHGQIGNYYFERNPTVSTYPEAWRIREVLRGASVPVVWLSGHVHWHTLTIVDAIPHVTLQSLTETATTYPDPAGAWGLLELDDTIRWQAYGLEPFAFTLDATATMRRWMAPLPPFGAVKDLASHPPVTG